MTLNLQGWDVVEVLWKDAETHDPWVDAAGLEEFASQDGLVATFGLLLQEDDQVVIVAASRDDGGKHAGVWKIPRALVRNVRVLGRSTAARAMQ